MRNTFKLWGRLALFAPLALGVLATSYIVDPALLFHDGEYERRLVDLIVEGHEVEGRGNFDERVFQRMRVARFDRAPDVVVFGSSRSMPLPHDAVWTDDFYNASLSGATLWDLIGLYELFRENDVLPRVI